MLSNVLTVRAGDMLLVCVDRQMTEEEQDAFWEQAKEGLPGVKVAFMESVTGLIIFRPETSEQ